MTLLRHHTGSPWYLYMFCLYFILYRVAFQCLKIIFAKLDLDIWHKVNLYTSFQLSQILVLFVYKWVKKKNSSHSVEWIVQNNILATKIISVFFERRMTLLKFTKDIFTLTLLEFSWNTQKFFHMIRKEFSILIVKFLHNLVCFWIETIDRQQNEFWDKINLRY